ncbi:MAG: CcmD family protein [Candidatus Kapaibacteriota bacterium]|jgi:uncharacterized phage infection (PIP) family protein YhgE
MFEFLSNNQLYIVLFVVLIIWIGLFIYLINVEKKIETIEKLVDSQFKNKGDEK